MPQGRGQGEDTAKSMRERDDQLCSPHIEERKKKSSQLTRRNLSV